MITGIMGDRFVIENSVWVPHVLKVDTSVRRLNVPVSFDQAERESLALWTFQRHADLLPRRDRAGSVRKNIMSDDVSAGCDCYIATTECSCPAVLRRFVYLTGSGLLGIET